MANLTDLPQVRFSTFGETGVRGKVILANSSSLTTIWSSDKGGPSEEGTDFLKSNLAFTAALRDFISSKVREMEALQEAESYFFEDCSNAPKNETPDPLKDVEILDADGEIISAIDGETTPSTLDPKRIDKQIQRLGKVSKNAEKNVLQFAELLNYGRGPEEKDRIGWCSACLNKTTHLKLREPSVWRDAWCCGECGIPSTYCSVPQCLRMAVRGLGATGQRNNTAPVCAEHNHEIPSFERQSDKVDDLTAWREIFVHEKANAVKIAKISVITTASVAVALPVFFLAGPAIGGAIGAAKGLHGAAATSHGLALLGFGAKSAGGLGMVGGQLVVAAAGAGLGGLVGLRSATAYLGSDKSFNIELLREGTGPAVVFSSGFFTEKDENWDAWRATIDQKYPDSPVYRVRWGAKELADVALLLGAEGGKVAIQAGLVAFAKQAHKKAAGKIGPVGPMFVAADLVANPWHTAVNRAAQASIAMAAILLRTKHDEGFILMGHSLGGALMARTILTLAQSDLPSPVVEAHLFGAAITRNLDSATLERGVIGRLNNYYSSNDLVLSTAFKIGSGGMQAAAGYRGFETENSSVRNIDVSATVPGHTQYLGNVQLQ